MVDQYCRDSHIFTALQSLILITLKSVSDIRSEIVTIGQLYAYRIMTSRLPAAVAGSARLSPRT